MDSSQLLHRLPPTLGMNKSWNVLSWNIRGLNSDKKILALRNAIDSSGCAIICIQETKRESFDLAFVKTFCPKNFDKFVFASSTGASGGIITIWNSSIFTRSPWHVSSFAVDISFVSTQSAESWNLVNVYGPCTGQERINFTSWLFDLHIPDDENWLVLGDFNFIRSTTNRNKPGGTPMTCFCLMKLYGHSR